MAYPLATVEMLKFSAFMQPRLLTPSKAVPLRRTMNNLPINCGLCGTLGSPTTTQSSTLVLTPKCARLLRRWELLQLNPWTSSWQSIGRRWNNTVLDWMRFLVWSCLFGCWIRTRIVSMQSSRSTRVHLECLETDCWKCFGQKTFLPESTFRQVVTVSRF